MMLLLTICNANTITSSGLSWRSRWVRSIVNCGWRSRLLSHISHTISLRSAMASMLAHYRLAPFTRYPLRRFLSTVITRISSVSCVVDSNVWRLLTKRYRLIGSWSTSSLITIPEPRELRQETLAGDGGKKHLFNATRPLSLLRNHCDFWIHHF